MRESKIGKVYQASFELPAPAPVPQDHELLGLRSELFFYAPEYIEQHYAHLRLREVLAFASLLQYMYFSTWMLLLQDFDC